MPGDDTTHTSETGATKGPHPLISRAGPAGKPNRVKAYNFERLDPQVLMQLHTERKTADINSIWTRIPLCGQDGLPEWVPSYLVRAKPQQTSATSTIESI